MACDTLTPTNVTTSYPSQSAEVQACELLQEWKPCECCANGFAGYDKTDGPFTYCINGTSMIASPLTTEKNCDDPQLGSRKAVPTWGLQTLAQWMASKQPQLYDIAGNPVEGGLNGTRVVTEGSDRVVTSGTYAPTPQTDTSIAQTAQLTLQRDGDDPVVVTGLPLRVTEDQEAVPVGTTTDFIASTPTAATTLVQTTGFSSPNGAGQSRWTRTSQKANPSQTPAQMGSPNLTDANGDVWTIVPENDRITARAVGAVGNNATDDTDALNAAGNSRYIVDISRGVYRITDQVSFQHLAGNVVTDSYFSVGTDFNMGAPAIVSLTLNDGSRIHGGVGIRCAQANTADLNAVTRYPWALEFEDKQRVKIDHVRVTGAWNGINANGNTGGFSGELLEIGAMNDDLLIDGARDYWHCDTVSTWPYGFLSGTLYALYSEATGEGIRIGTCDGLDIKSISAFRHRVTTFPGVTNGPFGSIQSLALDGSRATLTFAAGHISVGTSYSTSIRNDIGYLVTGGELSIATLDITPWNETNTGEPFVRCDGGVFLIGGGYARATVPDGPTFQCVSGRMSIGPIEFLTGRNNPRTVGFIEQTGGRLTVTEPRFDDIGSSGGTSPAITIGEGATWSRIACSNMLGWAYDIPAALSTNTFSFPQNQNRTVPTLVAAVTGDLAPAYIDTFTFHTLINNIVTFNCSVRFTHTDSTASGAMNIMANIPHLPIDATAVEISRIDGLTSSTDVRQVMAEIGEDGRIFFQNSHYDGSRSVVTIDDLAEGEIDIHVSGTYRAA